MLVDYRNLSRRECSGALGVFVAILALALATVAHAQDQDLTASYAWKPVKIGGGGYVVGMTIHPLNSAIRYCRTDVGNAYAWNDVSQTWTPMKVYLSPADGVQGPASANPTNGGVESVAIDPNNTGIVYMAFPVEYSKDIDSGGENANLELFKGTVTGTGISFTAMGLHSYGILSNPNGTNRTEGERLVVDPQNSNVLYLGSESQGLWRSMNGGSSWTQLANDGLPNNIEFINIQFDQSSQTTSLNGQNVTRTLYAVSISDGSGDGSGDVYRSGDGGASWSDISTGVTDPASGIRLATQAYSSSIASSGTLYISENSATDGWLSDRVTHGYWYYSGGTWTRVNMNSNIYQPVQRVVQDPSDPSGLRLYAEGIDTSLSRSDDGGVSWQNFGEPRYGNTLGWLPQTVGMTGDWHANGGLYLDAAGNLYTSTGQEGVLTIAAGSAQSATTGAPPSWTITSSGIEELVPQDLLVPPNSGDTLIVASEDLTGFVIPDPDNFSARQITLQEEELSQGSAAYAPDAPNYIAVSTEFDYAYESLNGVYSNYSGYSNDGGNSWTRFTGSPLTFVSGNTTYACESGQIAVGRRGERSLGSDHIVIQPSDDCAPEWSNDGGASWHLSNGPWPTPQDGVHINSAPTSYAWYGYDYFDHPHTLVADPFTEDTIYLKLRAMSGADLLISTDGGQNFTGYTTGLPDQTYYGTLVANPFEPNDFWFVDGWEGATAQTFNPHGLFHSCYNENPNNFTCQSGTISFSNTGMFAHAYGVAIGAPSPAGGAAPYTVYVYGQLAGNFSDPSWGVFQSIDGGATFNRVAYYPTGILDRVNAMAASQDTFGKVYVGFNGESVVYGQYSGGQAGGPSASAGGGGSSSSVIAIDSGGSANGIWVADVDYSGGNTSSTTAAIDTSQVASPAPQAVYQTQRWGAMTYTIPNLTPGGSYSVNLSFVEETYGGANQRQFNVLINGTTVLTNFDVYAAAGGENIAIDKTFAATANSSGAIVIQFTVGAYDQPAVSAIQITQTAPAAPTSLGATAASSSQINLSWTASSGATSYNIYRGTTSGGEAGIAIATGITTTSYLDTQLTASTTYYYKVAGVNAAGTSAQSNEASATTQSSGGASNVIAIDSGGPATGIWVADVDYSGGNTSSTTATINTSQITNPAPQAVYQTQRWGAMTYTIPNLTASASYTVNLSFVEETYGGANQRQFNVLINGTTVLTNFDVYAAAGGENIAIVKTFAATANSSGAIVIQFTVGAYDQPAVSAIQITQTSAPVDVKINSGGAATGGWLADVDYSGGNTSSTTATINTAQVSSPAPQAVYQTQRWGAMTYTIPNLAAAASYTVSLSFVEETYGGANQRQFNTLINGTTVLTNFDVYAAAGGQNIAIVKNFTTTANSSGAVVIQFTAGAYDQPAVSAIEVH